MLLKKTCFKLSDKKNGPVYITPNDKEELITKGDAEVKVRLQSVLQILLDLRLKNCILPIELSKDRLISLLDQSYSAIKSSINVWHNWEKKNEMKKELRLKVNRKALIKTAPPVESQTEYSWLEYSFFRNSLFLPVGRTRINHLYSRMMATVKPYSHTLCVSCFPCVNDVHFFIPLFSFLLTEFTIWSGCGI